MAQQQTLERIDHADALHNHRFKYYDFAMAAFVAILICSNLIGAAKLVQLFEFKIGSWNVGMFGAGILFFPLSYVLGDVMTEVYGYARARRVVWAGFGAVLFMAFMSWVVVSMPPAPGWEGQAAYEAVFGLTPRIVFASIIAFWAGELANAFVMARMKVASGGKHLWQRTIGSTVVGQGVDSVLFYPIAFLGVWSTSQVLTVLATNYLLKVLWEAVLTPVTYRVVAALKRAEGVDVYDADTNFTPFSLRS
ncbi:queuosine precursor transporter [Marinicaulis aureus]|uniref:Probable queuosine precursor transporter n=1 Tax=Hyphococcus aureus TaxID=2666033 RepID=A0ABW1KVY0_9PROT